jgi:hypothetical protein
VLVKLVVGGGQRRSQLGLGVVVTVADVAVGEHHNLDRVVPKAATHGRPSAQPGHGQRERFSQVGFCEHLWPRLVRVLELQQPGCNVRMLSKRRAAGGADPVGNRVYEPKV